MLQNLQEKTRVCFLGRKGLKEGKAFNKFKGNKIGEGPR